METVHRFFLASEQWAQPNPVLAAPEVHHLARVLRLRPGAVIEVFDGGGQVGTAAVRALAKKRVELEWIGRRRDPAPEPALTLFQAVPRASKMDWIVQKAVELGAVAVVPLLTARAVVRLTPDEADRRRERWQQIALQAARQCGAAWMTRVERPSTLEEAAPRLRAHDALFVGSLEPDAIPFPRAAAAARARAARHLGVAIGPEGDFDGEEYRFLREVGGVPTSFGSLTLRTETAALYALSVLRHEFTPGAGGQRASESLRSDESGRSAGPGAGAG